MALLRQLELDFKVRMGEVPLTDIRALQSIQRVSSGPRPLKGLRLHFTRVSFLNNGISYLFRRKRRGYSASKINLKESSIPGQICSPMFDALLVECSVRTQCVCLCACVSVCARVRARACVFVRLYLFIPISLTNSVIKD